MAEIAVILSPEAIEDLSSIYAFLYQQSPSAAASIARKLTGRIRQLSWKADPGSPEYRIPGANLRYLVEGNYKILYRKSADRVIVTQIFDCRQHPDKIRG